MGGNALEAVDPWGLRTMPAWWDDAWKPMTPPGSCATAECAAGLSPVRRPPAKEEPTWGRKCKEQYYRDRYDEFTGHLINEFSPYSYVAPDRAINTWALTGVGITSKYGTYKAVSATFGPKAATLVGRGLGFSFAAFAPGFAFGAETSATWECGCGYLD